MKGDSHEHSRLQGLLALKKQPKMALYLFFSAKALTAKPWIATRSAGQAVKLC